MRLHKEITPLFIVARDRLRLRIANFLRLRRTALIFPVINGPLDVRSTTDSTYAREVY